MVSGRSDGEGRIARSRLLVPGPHRFSRPHSGGNLLLETIVAVVIGGVSLAGGKGTVLNDYAGTLLLVGLSNLDEHSSYLTAFAGCGEWQLMSSSPNIMMNTRLDPG